jgi:hypothetical protein
MKTLFGILLSGIITLSAAGQGSQALYDAFPAMPSSLSNDDLQKVSKGVKLDNKLAVSLDEDHVSGTWFFPIGKIETKKSVILIYGRYHDFEGDNGLLNGVIQTFNKKTGEPIPGGLQHYVFMTGEDALRRESTVKWDGTTLSVTIVSYNRDTKEQTESESTTYKLSGDKLEFAQ